VIAARLDTLEPGTKALLGDAAVIGKVFWAGAVAQMGDRDPVAASATLGELVRRELVAPARRSSMAGEAEYAFGHALVRDVAYEQLPRTARASRHRAAATWIEAKVSDRVEDFADVLAHHYATALELAQASDEPEQAAELEAPALRFLTLAGRRALGLDSTTALASFERALALTPHGHPARAGVLAGLGEAALEAGRLPDAVAALEEAIAAYRNTGNARAAARSAVVLSEVYVLQRNRQRLDMLTDVLELIQPLPPGPEHVAVLTEISGEHHQREEWEMGLAVADRALALAAELGLGRPARTLGYRATNRGHLGELDAMDDFREALEVALAAGEVRHASTIYNNWANHRRRNEGPAQALETQMAGITLCRARGLAARVKFMTPGALLFLFELGEFDQMLAAASDYAERARVEGDTLALAQAQRLEAQVRLVRGQADEFAALGDELEAGIRETTGSSELAQRLSAAAWIRAALGQREPAIAYMTRFAKLPHGAVAHAVDKTVRTAIDLGSIDIAVRLAADATPEAQLLVDAAMAEARGDLATVADDYAKVADWHRSRGELVHLGGVLVDLGGVLARLGRTAEAVEALNEARPILKKLGAAPLLAKTEALLEQLTAVSA
jgi:tetratricopeptide (TPR) repeat protein